MRLTTSKPAAEMGMWELTHNCCYIGEDRCVRYRDFETDKDARALIIGLMQYKGMLTKEETRALLEAPEDLDEIMFDNLQYPITDQDGLLAFLYMLIVACAELREALKRYEDIGEAEEFRAMKKDPGSA